MPKLLRIGTADRNWHRRPSSKVSETSDRTVYHPTLSHPSWPSTSHSDYRAWAPAGKSFVRRRKQFSLPEPPLTCSMLLLAWIIQPLGNNLASSGVYLSRTLQGLKTAPARREAARICCKAKHLLRKCGNHADSQR